jgi:hypothetical protein
MSDQMELFDNIPYRVQVESKLEADQLKMIGQNLISDNWDSMLQPDVRGKTRHNGKWIVCYRPHLEEYVLRVNHYLERVTS